MSDNPVRDIAHQLEQSFDLRSGFLADLLRSDDWSFVIKSHALLEAVLAQLLTQHIGDARLHPVFEQLEVSNTKTGKIAFIRALSLLSDDEQKFVRRISELRNELVHRVSNVNLELLDYIGPFDKNQRKSWQDAIAYFVPVEPGRSQWRANALTNPKVTIWLGTVYLVARVQLGIVTARSERDRVESRLTMLQKILEEGDDTNEGTPPQSAA